MSISWRLEAECSGFSFLQGDGLLPGPAPPWRQAPIRSPTLGRPPCGPSELSSPQPNRCTPPMLPRERARSLGSRRIGRSNNFMDLNTRTRMIPAASIQVRQQRPSYSVLFARANAAPICARSWILLLLLIFASLPAESVLAAPTVTVTSPNGGENWTAGSTYNVTWSISGNTSSINYTSSAEIMGGFRFWKLSQRVI